MHNSFFDVICRIGIFMICAQAIIHFRPQEAYEKYLKLLVSIMVLIQLFLPIGSFFLKGNEKEAASVLEQFKREMEQNMKEIEENSAAMDALLEQMTLEEVRSLIEAREEGGQTELGEGPDDEGYSSGSEEPDIEMEVIEPITVGPISLEDAKADS